MKTETEAVTFDDLIFEKRNKAYGAYDIRKSYSGTTTKAMLICLACAVAIILLSSFRLFSKKEIVDTKDDDDVIQFLPVPPIDPVKPQTQTKLPPPARNEVRDLPPVATTEDVPDLPEQIVQTATVVDGPTDPNGVESNVSSVGVEPVDTPPAIIEDKEFITAEVMPSYVGGVAEMMQYLQRKLRYPAKAQRMETQGTVYVGFVINREGKVVNVSLVKGISEECDKEAMRVISAMPAWKAGSQQGVPVSVRMVLPVTFRLNRN